MISLLAPSRWRPEKCIANLKKWSEDAGEPCEVIISLDSDDESAPEYTKLSQELPSVKIIIGNHFSMVDALNHAAREAKGNILISVFDDFSSFPEWDLEVSKRLLGQDGKVLFVRDGLGLRNPWTPELQSMSIMTRGVFEGWGYFWWHEYQGVFADNDYTEHAIFENRVIDAPDLTFYHRHYKYGDDRSSFDRTYAWGNDPHKYSVGKIVFERRRRENFQLPAL